MGYPIEGVVLEGEGGAEAEKPIAFTSLADAAKGEQVFKKCAACHNADPGGANALGPNLCGVLGKPHRRPCPGFAYSDALKGVGGNWDWDKMSAWLANPKKFAPGTKMTFAGLSNPQDRADLIAFLNSRSGSPLPLPAAPAEAAARGRRDKAAAESRRRRRAEGRERAGPQPGRRGQGRTEEQRRRRRQGRPVRRWRRW